MSKTLESALTVAPGSRERMQRFETGRNDESDTYYVAATDRTVLIAQIDRASREIALRAAPPSDAAAPLREALLDFVALLPPDRWDLLRPETIAAVDAALATPAPTGYGGPIPRREEDTDE